MNDKAIYNGKHKAFSQDSFTLTKREYFAVMALQGMIAGCTGAAWPNADACAKKAVECADALLLELENTSAK